MGGPHPPFPQRQTHLPFGKYPTTVVPVTNKLMPVNARAILQKEGSYALANPQALLAERPVSPDHGGQGPWACRAPAAPLPAPAAALTAAAGGSSSG